MSISVIIVVYNMGEYLSRCIDSILSQTYTDFELIIVDDGSTDNCLHICKEYQKKDDRIVVCHTEHVGVGAARQKGLDMARGAYFIYADADDWVEKEMLEIMYASAINNNADVVISDFYYDYVDGTIAVSHQSMEYSHSREVLNEIISERKFGGLCHKLIKRSLIDKYSVRFIRGVSFTEDVLLLAQLLNNDVRISYVDVPTYHYCMENGESITRHYTYQTFLSRVNFVNELRKILPDRYYSDSIWQTIFNIKMEALSNGYLDAKTFDGILPLPIIFYWKLNHWQLRCKLAYTIYNIYNCVKRSLGIVNYLKDYVSVYKEIKSI